MARPLNIVHLYAREMNIYGDNGNVLALEYRAKQYGLKVDVKVCNIGDKLEAGVDIIVAGGGQDNGQIAVQNDLHRRKDQLLDMFNDGVVCLSVCGMYQLLGREFVTQDKKVLDGLGYFDIQTTAGDKRLVGNILVDTGVGQVVGFENHSGQTQLGKNQPPFGKVLKGAGNNGSDNTEGAVTKNVIGTYLHGPILPKNPKLTDDLLRRALDRRHGQSALISGEQVNDSIAEKAFRVAMSRF